MTHISFPYFETERLKLQMLDDSDWKTISFLRSDEKVNTYVNNPKNETENEAKAFIQKITNGIETQKWYYWSISLKNHPETIGTICLWNFSEDKKIAEVGYVLHPKFQQKGIMSEALNRIIHYGFSILNLHSMEAYTHENNEPSKLLLLKNNFVLMEDKVDPYNSDNIVFNLQ